LNRHLSIGLTTLMIVSSTPTLAHVARDAYSTRFGCAVDAVSVAARPDVEPHTLLHPRAPVSPADDPLAYEAWQQRVQLQAAFLDQFHVYDVAGCGRRVRWVCEDAWSQAEVPRCDLAEAILP
jgi:hypothetical protein